MQPFRACGWEPAISVIAFGVLLGSSSSAVEGPSCSVQEVEYAIAGNLKVSETTMGQGNGIYKIGPGRAVLRFEGNNVQMVSLTMEEHLSVRANTLFGSTTVVTDARSRATPNACSGAAEGILSGRVLSWRTPVSGYRTDGALRCEGAFCGRAGAPPPGQSPLHIGPNAAPFKPFVFSPDMTTFTMATTAPVKTEQPKQASELALSGRQISRRCIAAVPRCGSR